MPKPNSDGGYRLPAVIDPEERICVTVRVPNDLMHLIAFWGALEELARWWNWERDALKRGREAAAVWRAVIDEARANTVYGECPGGNVQVRQRPGEPCKLDVDYGSGWQQFADLRLCAPEVSVTPDGGINIGGTTVYPSAPLGVDPATNMPRQPQPRPQPASASRPVCRAAANLIDVLILTHSELCARIDRPDAEKALAAIAVFAAVLVYPPNLIWALPLVAAFATINSICDEITDTTRTDAICAILSTGSVDASGRVTFDRDALIDALNPTGRPDIARIGFIAGYLDETSLNYAASVDMGGAADCPCEEDWCVYFDFTNSSGGWQSTTIGGRPAAAYSSGVGWVRAGNSVIQANESILIRLALEEQWQLTSVTLELSEAINGVPSNSGLLVRFNNTDEAQPAPWLWPGTFVAGLGPELSLTLEPPVHITTGLVVGITNDKATGPSFALIAPAITRVKLKLRRGGAAPSLGQPCEEP